MQNKLKTALAVLAMVISFVAGGFYGFFGFDRKPSAPVITSATKIDTVTVEKPVLVEKIKYVRLPAKTDTVYRYKDRIRVEVDTVYSAEIRSTIDTVLQDNGTNYGRLYVAYWHPPLDFFNMDFIPAPLPEKMVIKTVYVAEKPKWWEKKEVWAGAAILIGTVISEARK